MLKPMKGIGAWAAEAEAEDERQAAVAAAAPQLPALSFPSLKEANAAKPKKKKPMSLSEFNTGGYAGPGGRRDGGFEVKGLTPSEMRRLPTGPKERSQEEMDFGRHGGGGGFRNYGRRDEYDGGGGGGGSYGSGGERRGYGSGFDDERRSNPPRGEFQQPPSRADEVDNWAGSKKTMVPGPGPGPGRVDRYSSLESGGGGVGGGSRADEVDNWAMGKKPLPVRATEFSSGIREREIVAPESERWVRGQVPPPQLPRRGFGQGDGEGEKERPRLVLDKPRGDLGLNEVGKSTRPSPFAAARPREEVLAGKGLDWRKLETEIEKKSSRPSSSHSSRPTSSHSNRPESPGIQVLEGVKARPKVNPFGDAKPREVLLQEQGIDWRKIDFELEHRGVERAETNEEKELKEQIDHLKKELENEVVISNGVGEPIERSDEEQTNLPDLIRSKERDLEHLMRELDDKVRFGQRAIERPGSGAGKVVGVPERPPSSHSGMSGEFRNMEFMDRPRSRGTGEFRNTGYMDRPQSRGTGEFTHMEFMDRPRSTGEFRNTGYMDRPRSRGTGEFRNVEFMDGPRSFGTGDGWSKPEDGRRAFPGGRERGFLGNRDMDRPRSRERW